MNSTEQKIRNAAQEAVEELGGALTSRQIDAVIQAVATVLDDELDALRSRIHDLEDR